MPPKKKVTTAPKKKVTTTPKKKIITAPKEKVITAPKEKVTTAPKKKLITAPKKKAKPKRRRFAPLTPEMRIARLENLKEDLEKVLRTVGIELQRTDVEWLNLSYVAETSRQPKNKPSTSKMRSREVVQNQIDFENIAVGDLPELNLNPIVVTSVWQPSAIEEFDTDSD